MYVGVAQQFACEQDISQVEQLKRHFTPKLRGFATGATVYIERWSIPKAGNQSSTNY